MAAWWTGLMTSLGTWLVNPWIFAFGVAAVSVPIIIHLLNRRKFKIVDWAAMDFLLEADKKNRRRVRLENWLLLFLRCLAVFLIGLMLARPYDSTGLAAGLFDAQKFERIVLVDDSLSTQARVNNRSVNEIMQERLVDLARMFASEKSDNSLTLLLASNPEQRKYNGTHIGPENVDEIAAELERIEVSDQPARLDAALQEIDDYLASQPPNVNRVVYIVSDMRRRDWQPDQSSTETATKATTSAAKTESQPVELVRKIAKQAKGCFIVDVGDKEDRNLVIREVSTEDKALVAGVESRFKIYVANKGSQEVRDVRVKFTAGDSVPVTQTIEQIAPGAEELVQVPITFVAEETENTEKTVSRKVKVEVVPERGAEDDRLAADSTAYFAARVVPGIPTLVVDGDPSARYGKSETFYLRRALNPPGKVLSGVAATIVADTELESVELRNFQVAVLCNLHQLTDKFVDELKIWVANGGGLVIFPGDQVDEEYFNTRLYGVGESEGKELSPVRLEEMLGDETEAKWVNFKIEDVKHKVLQGFVGQQTPLLESVKIFRWWKETVKKGGESTASVFVRLTDSEESPAFVERAYGKGRVVVAALPCDADWSDWSSGLSYIPFLQELVRYLAPGDAATGVVRVGEPLKEEIDLTKTDLNADLTLPGERKISLQASHIEGAEDSRWLLEQKTTPKQGFYEFTLTNKDNTKSQVLFAANVDPSEGDLRRANVDEMQKELRDVGVQFISGMGTNLSGVGAQVEIWKYLLWALVGLLLGEQVLGWLFGLKR
jgi:aerotolerance regulator-like protein/CARDB protein